MGNKDIDGLMKTLKDAGLKPKLKKVKTISKEDADFTQAELEKMNTKIRELGIPVSSPASRKKEKTERFEKLKKRLEGL